MNLTDYSKLSIHTITTKAWSVEEAIDRYAEAGVGGITVWRQWLEGQNTEAIGARARAAGLEIVATCRGGFFPAVNDTDREKSIEENRGAILEAAELGAPMVVLVCGSVPCQSLDESRKQIAAGIEAVLPFAEEHQIKLAIEPLHPMYADNRSAINTMASANQLCDQIDHPLVGIAADVYHIWWDPDLECQIQLTGEKGRLFAFHICDWKTPTTDFLNDRGLMGEGCIDISGIRSMVENAGFSGYHEVEIFSESWWARDPDEFFNAILNSYLEYS